jgi:transcriptional regulator with GAF, ATPase, and Fis domain
MCGSLQDITERKQTELNLKAALSEIKELKDKLEVERAYLQEEIKLEYNYENIIGQSDGLNYVLYKVERDHIFQVLEQTNWKLSGKNGAAEILGLNRSTLRARVRKLGIRRP